MAKVCLPYGFCQKLKCDLGPNEQCLVLTDKEAMYELCCLLGEDKYTNLIISDCVRHEIVHVTCYCGELVMKRAQGDSKPTAFLAGATVAFQLTPQLVMAGLACLQMEDGTGVTIKSDTLTVKQDEDDPLCWNVDLKKLEKPLTWCATGTIYTQDEYGIITGEPDPACAGLKDGKYKNATICIDGKKLISAEEGSPVVANACGKCCDACEKEEGE